MSKKTYFAVAVGSSTDMQRHPSPDFTCEHKHKTPEAARHCQEKLIGFDAKTRQCSAKWYNSFVVVGGCSTGSGYRTVGNWAESPDNASANLA